MIAVITNQDGYRKYNSVMFVRRCLIMYRRRKGLKTQQNETKGRESRIETMATKRVNERKLNQAMAFGTMPNKREMVFGIVVTSHNVTRDLQSV